MWEDIVLGMSIPCDYKYMPSCTQGLGQHHAGHQRAQGASQENPTRCRAQLSRRLPRVTAGGKARGPAIRMRGSRQDVGGTDLRHAGRDRMLHRQCSRVVQGDVPSSDAGMLLLMKFPILASMAEAWRQGNTARRRRGFEALRPLVWTCLTHVRAIPGHHSSRAWDRGSG